MISVEVDEDVYSHLTNQAVAFVDKSPNDVLRRLLGINKSLVQTQKSSHSTNTFRRRRKKPKTNLSKLINVGLLKNGQDLFLRDYQGNSVNNISAKLTNGFLVYKAQSYSMSDLAKILLKENGFQSESVRGPIFWFTENGKSIKDLWDSFLKNHYK